MAFLPSLSALRAFEAAARHENFRKTAEELHLTQGAVAQQIRGLEADLKTDLFKRLPRGVALTAAGEIYAGKIRAGLQALQEATDDLMPGENVPELILSTTPSFASCWLLPRLAGFPEKGRIDLQVRASENVADLLTGEADLAIRQVPPPYTKGLKSRMLCAGQNVIVGRPDLMSGMRQPSDLISAGLLHDGHAGWSGYFRENAAELSGDIEKGMRFNQAAMCIRLACSGDGVALVPEVLVEQEIKEGALAVFSGPAPEKGSDFYLVWSEKHGRRRDVSRVCDWLLREAES
ncbi:LysR substrate-binding domain-containing protein [Thalassobius sp. I31.1]|uniref:LysR substrate-binding domain-containing protein n=1 Tax=Thalassobius sp. I31.1 TaxID=2109912 RepID=UPI0018E505B5|nr:LysR substrate-binding domain-containing protein [Thalassobius sp. I31.1]